jgi:DNA polymerase III epsilon subunit-like protein
MYLFFDVETADAPPPRGTSASATEAWPRLVQLGWVACDAGGRETATREDIVRPDGFGITSGAAAIHGIDTARAAREGHDLRVVLMQFTEAVDAADVLVAHNFEFDQSVLGAEYARAGVPRPDGERRHVCTMLGSTDYCKFPGRYGKYKWPRLDELHHALFGEAFLDAHSALADARACMRCFFKLNQLGVVT